MGTCLWTTGEGGIGTERTRLMERSQLGAWAWPVKGIGEGGL